MKYATLFLIVASVFLWYGWEDVVLEPFPPAIQSILKRYSSSPEFSKEQNE